MPLIKQINTKINYLLFILYIVVGIGTSVVAELNK